MRVEEKLLLSRLAERRDVELIRIDDGELTMDIAGGTDIAASTLESARALGSCDVVVLRSISQTKNLVMARILDSWGIACVNPAAVVECCADKVRTTLALSANQVPTIPTLVAISPDAALRAIESMGYPCVIKPTTGSWGRLVARVNDREAAEALLEHKSTLGGSAHSVFYIQAYVDKPGRDIRAFYIGGRTVAAITRSSGHWITNTARGAQAQGYPISEELDSLCRRAAEAVGGGALALDVFEQGDRLLVNEVNATMEFRNSVEPTGVDIPGLLVSHALEVSEQRRCA